MMSYRVRNCVQNFLIGAGVGMVFYTIVCVLLTVVERFTPRYDLTTWAMAATAIYFGWLMRGVQDGDATEVQYFIRPEFYPDMAFMVGMLLVGGFVGQRYSHPGHNPFAMLSLFVIAYSLRSLLGTFRRSPKSTS